MSRETWEILQQMEPKDVELQLALQCAPLIAGLKPSNLFNIPCEGVCQVRELIRDTGISMYVLFSTGRKAAVLLYRRESLKKYMEQEPVVGMLHKLGYQDTSLEAVLPVFRPLASFSGIFSRKPLQAGTLSPGHISLKSSRVTLKYVFPFRQESHRRISMRKKRTSLQATSKG